MSGGREERKKTVPAKFRAEPDTYNARSRRRDEDEDDDDEIEILAPVKRRGRPPKVPLTQPAHRQPAHRQLARTHQRFCIKGQVTHATTGLSGWPSYSLELLLDQNGKTSLSSVIGALVINKAFPEHNPNSISYLYEKQLMTMNTERDFEVMMSRQMGADEILLYVMRPPKPSGSTGSVGSGGSGGGRVPIGSGKGSHRSGSQGFMKDHDEEAEEVGMESMKDRILRRHHEYSEEKFSIPIRAWASSLYLSLQKSQFKESDVNVIPAHIQSKLNTITKVTPQSSSQPPLSVPSSTFAATHRVKSNIQTDAFTFTAGQLVKLGGTKSFGGQPFARVSFMEINALGSSTILEHYIPVDLLVPIKAPSPPPPFRAVETGAMQGRWGPSGDHGGIGGGGRGGIRSEDASFNVGGRNGGGGMGDEGEGGAVRGVGPIRLDQSDDEFEEEDDNVTSTQKL